MKNLQRKQMALFEALRKTKNKKDIPGLESIALSWNLDRNTRIKALDTIRGIGGDAARNGLRRIAEKSDDLIGRVAKDMLDKMEPCKKKKPTDEMLPIQEGALS